ncbi:MAG: hypothetical protein JWP12_2518 [Bacteroidetes bacterium]|nr:hypothetical protein [Bacteroidota bacterium]
MKNRSICITIFLIIVSCSILTTQFSWKGTDGKGYTHVIQSDGKGYYEYLPSIFIKKNIAEQTPDDRFIFKTETGNINKYYAGTAVAMLPFFTAGYIKAGINHDPQDGYSPPFQKAISIAGLFYLCIGLIFMSRFLLLYNIKPTTVCITLLLMVFGTNLLMYAVYHPSFSHIYSFAFITMFLFYAKKYSDTYTHKYALLMSLAFAMILIIRPSNGIVIFMLPFLTGSAPAFKQFLRSFFQLKTFVISTFAFFVVISIQLILWHIQTGKFVVWSYQNEGFYFLHPQIWNVLFSFRKGFFIYTPLALLSLGGLFFIYRENRFRFYSIALFLLLLIYITASWWCWYYGPSFGQRSFIEFYAANALLLAILIDRLTYKKLLYAVAIVLSLFNLLQSYQYVKDILSSWDMNAEKYSYVFMRTSPRYYSCFGGCDDIQPYSKTQTLLYDLKNDFEKQDPNWSESTTKKADDPHTMVSDYSGKEFNSGIEIVADSALPMHRLLYAEVQLDYSENATSGNESPLMVVEIKNGKDETYQYYTFALNEIPNRIGNAWKTGNYTIEIPRIRSTGDHLKMYVWNKDHQTLFIDNFHIKLYGID